MSKNVTKNNSADLSLVKPANEVSKNPTEILSLKFYCQSGEDKAIAGLLNDRQGLQLQSILTDLYYKGVKLKIDYDVIALGNR